jgi:flavin-dependent dehydrogenase
LLYNVSMRRDFTLKYGSRVAVIGGGPAGSFFAHFVQKYAQQKGIKLSVTIFDGKDFLQRGPKGCNLCAGVLSASLHQKLNEEGIYLPERRIINSLDGYKLHVDDEHLLLSCEENKKDRITTVFRGNGPRYSTFPHVVSFDDFLMSWAQDRGVHIISQPVWDIRLPKTEEDAASLFFGRKGNLQRFDVDLVVGAFGVNSYLMNKMQGLGFGYKPPSTLTTFQAEFNLGRENVLKNFENMIHIYMPGSTHIRYATVIPKGDYLSITLVGKKDITTDIFSEFYSLQEIRNKIPLSKPHCFCYPKIVVSPSRKPFSDRLVIIGDAGFSRHYKNGIESAFLTAKLAAETAVKVGIDASSFYSHYFRKAKKLIVHDNAYGRFLFMLNDIISSIPLLAEAHLSLARRKDKAVSARKLRFILWNMFTGNIPYKDIFKTSLDIRLQASLLLNVLRLIIPGSKKSLRRDTQRKS